VRRVCVSYSVIVSSCVMNYRRNVVRKTAPAGCQRVSFFSSWSVAILCCVIACAISSEHGVGRTRRTRSKTVVDVGARAQVTNCYFINARPVFPHTRRVALRFRSRAGRRDTSEKTRDCDRLRRRRDFPCARLCGKRVAATCARAGRKINVAVRD